MFRQDFPILDKIIYLDNAATTQKPQSVISAIVDFYTNFNCSTHSSYDLAVNLENKIQETRQKVKKFLKAEKSEEIVFTSGATDGLNLLAYSLPSVLDLKPSDEILLTEMEHHANLVPWQRLAFEKNLKLQFIPILETGELDLEIFNQLLSEKTKIVSITGVSNVLGVINPTEYIFEMVKKKTSAITILDATQSAPHIPLEVKNTDFLVFSAHKLFGPTGIGILYGKYDLLNRLKPYKLGGNMIDKVNFQDYSYQDCPIRFEAGTKNFAGIIGLSAALDYLFPKLIEIYNYENELNIYLENSLAKIPNLHTFTTKNTLKVPSTAFYSEKIHPLDLDERLNLQNIAIRSGNHCCQPLHQKLQIPSTNRVSLAFYNNYQEVDKLVEVLWKLSK